MDYIGHHGQVLKLNLTQHNYIIGQSVSLVTQLILTILINFTPSQWPKDLFNKVY